MLGFGIVGAGLMPGDRRIQESLAPQDNLYTLVERSGAEEAVTVIGSLAGVAFAGEGSAALLDAMDQPSIRIVSLTVTENGYCLNRATKRLDPEHPLIRRDLADPAQPSSAIGMIVEAARRRRDAGAQPFTAMTCDNIQHNGDVLRDAVLALARLRDPALADWIEANIPFPNTMVDRITPVTAEADVESLGRPARHPGPLAGVLRDVHAMGDRGPLRRRPPGVGGGGRAVRAGRGALRVHEAAPAERQPPGRVRDGPADGLRHDGRGDGRSPDAPLHGGADGPGNRADAAGRAGVDIAEYKATLIRRFANTAIKDTVERINTDAPMNVLLDPIRDRLRAGAPLDLLALALAAWLRRIRGEDEAGQPIEIRHPMAALLRERAAAGGEDPAPLLGITELFGEAGADPRLVQPVGRWLAMLYRSGSRATLAEAAGRLGSESRGRRPPGLSTVTPCRTPGIRVTLRMRGGRKQGRTAAGKAG